MEFHEKLQELRRQKELTQEDLAQALFVSRTAVSKWESGRGYPNIESLKAVAKFFAVTVDELLSGEELLSIAEESTRQKEQHFRDMIFGLLDCCAALFFFLPLFGERANGSVQAVSLLSLAGIAPYLRVIYYGVVTGMMLMGCLTLVLQNCRRTLWMQSKGKVSVLLNAAGTLLFIISLQPYAAVFLFIFLAIKVTMLPRWQ